MADRRSSGVENKGNGYSVAVILTFFALVLALVFHPIARHSSFNLFQGAVLLSALYGGLGPGIVSCILSIIAIDYFFITPLFAFGFDWFDDGLNLVIFGAVALMTSSLSARIRKAKAEIQQAHGELELRIQERTMELSHANARLTAEVDYRLEAEKALLDISNREQRRMGQDLHDGLCQNLAGLRLLADVLGERLTAQASPDVKYIEKIEARLSEALAQADGVSRGLYPVELETNGFVAALREMTKNYSEIYSVSCQLVVRQDIYIEDSAVATHLFRITQEAVMNAIKGGKSSNIIVRIFAWEKKFALVIADRGIGFNPSSQRKGMGLKIMEYRSRMVNAEFKLRARVGAGTLVSCSLSSDILKKEAHHDL
jgi:signal transduction histidine kinase